jgi:YVTN family beta-propeller protein
MIVSGTRPLRPLVACSSLTLSAILATVGLAQAGNLRTNAAVGGSSAAAGLLPTGQYISALVSPGSSYQRLRTFLRPDGNADGNGALSTALSPDGKTLLVLTSGYNTGFATTSGLPVRFPYLDPRSGKLSSTLTGSYQWVCVYDVSSGVPVERQALPIPSSFAGIAWDPSGSRFFASGGQDDRVYAYVSTNGKWVPEPPFPVLNHNSNDSAPKPKYDGGIFKNTPAGRSPIGQRYGLDFGALTAGVTVSADGKQIYVANMEDDSVSVLDANSRKVVWDLKLFNPGSTLPKGEYPYWVSAHAAADGSTDKLFISSIRDGQVVSIAKTGRQNVIDLGGEPGKMLMSRDGSRLYVANPDLDEIDEIDTASERLTRRISVLRPGYQYHGANPNSLALTADGRTLYATLGGENSVAVIDVAGGTVSGRIPTGWYPTSVALSNDDSRLFIANRKANTGPDLDGGFGKPPPYGVNSNTNFKNEYIEALEKAGLLTVPVPDSQTLAYLSAVVDANNNYSASAVRPSAMMQYLHRKIKHVIYVMKENRTYDQMLGDLPVGNGEPRLVMYPQPVTPNFHALALRFADLDNFYAPSQSSGDGWEWTWQGHVNDFSELTESYYFAGQGPSSAMDFAPFFGSPRLINLALPLRSAHPGPVHSKNHDQLGRQRRVDRVAWNKRPRLDGGSR